MSTNDDRPRVFHVHGLVKYFIHGHNTAVAFPSVKNKGSTLIVNGISKSYW